MSLAPRFPYFIPSQDRTDKIKFTHVVGMLDKACVFVCVCVCVC